MENELITCGELHEAAKPLVNLLRKKGHPHMTAIVTQISAEITVGIVAELYENVPEHVAEALEAKKEEK